MTITHVMIDLETWGTSPGCDIRSIGACVFDPVTGYVAGGSDAPAIPLGAHGGISGTFYLATDNPRGYWGNGSSRDRFFDTGKPTDRFKYSLKRDASTIRWWADQSAEAQAAFENPVDLYDALRRFDQWLTDVAPDQRVVVKTTRGEHAVSTAPLWSHGAAADGPWLAAAYEAVGLPIPWHYRAPRDTRTCFDMAGIDDHSAWLAQHPGPLGIEHHALDDAICQARAVCAAYERLRQA